MLTVEEGEAQEFWTLMLRTNHNDHAEEYQLAIDSGSEIHVAPLSFGSKYQLVASSAGRLEIKGAGGEHLQHFGKRWVPLEIGGFDALIEFEVADVQKPILSVSELARKGIIVILEMIIV